MPEIRYVKITLLDGARFILRVTGETPLVISGFEVNAEGDEVVPTGHDRRLRIVGRDSIRKIVELRMSRRYATLEPAPKSAAQLDADINEVLRRRVRHHRSDGRSHAARKRIPAVVREAIEANALEFIQGAYRRFADAGDREPRLSVGLITDYLRQAHMPEDFRWATSEQQRTWTRSTLESLRRRSKISSSLGATARFYEPAH